MARRSAPGADSPASQIYRNSSKCSEPLTTAAHYSGGNPDMVGYRFMYPGSGNVQLIMEVEYYGALTSKRYVASVNVVFEPDGTGWTIGAMSFSDAQNRISANAQSIAVLRKNINKILDD